MQYCEKNTKKIAIQDTLHLVYKFLRIIDSSYADYLIKRVNDGSMEFSTQFEVGQSLYNLKLQKRRIMIPIKYTIDDAYIIIHELLHDYNLDINNLSVARHLFTETISILGEILFKDYLKQNNLFVEDYQKRIKNDFWFIKRIAFKNDFEIKLMLYYLENGYIDKSVVSNILCDTNESYVFQANYSLMDANEFETMSLDISQRYIIGGLFASYMHERILKNPQNIEEFKEINDIINYINFEDVVNYFDLEVENYDNFVLTDESVKRLQKSYNNELKRL